MKILMLLLCLFVFAGCENTKKQLPNSSVESESEYESEYYEIINLTKFKELYASNEAKLIYFGSDGCSACLSFKPIAKQYAKDNKIKIYFLRTDDLTSDEYTELNSLVSFEYIPFITVYKNKEMLYGESGVMTADELTNLVTTYGVKSE